MQVQETAMPEPAVAVRRRLSSPLVVAAAAVAALLAGTLALWAHYGTAVFYETILAGIATCF
jgi:hypothetical protein